MLKSLTPNTEQLPIVRLAAVSNTCVQKLLNRGISPESFPEIQGRLKKLNVVIESSQLINKIFKPSPNHPSPFPKTRFSNGDEAVFYSALEDETSIEEVRYHQTRSGEFSDLENLPNAPMRYFDLYEIGFSGTVLDLFNIHQTCPDLTSKDESGYPKCRQLAEEARSESIDAFRTPSARQQGGTCTPVFDRKSLEGVPRLKYRGRFTNEYNKIIFKKL